MSLSPDETEVQTDKVTCPRPQDWDTNPGGMASETVLTETVSHCPHHSPRMQGTLFSVFVSVSIFFVSSIGCLLTHSLTYLLGWLVSVPHKCITY